MRSRDLLDGLNRLDHPSRKKLLLVELGFQPVHDAVVDAPGIEEFEELLAACFHGDQDGTVVLESLQITDWHEQSEITVNGFLLSDAKT